MEDKRLDNSEEIKIQQEIKRLTHRLAELKGTSRQIIDEKMMHLIGHCFYDEVMNSIYIITDIPKNRYDYNERSHYNPQEIPAYVIDLGNDTFDMTEDSLNSYAYKDENPLEYLRKLYKELPHKQVQKIVNERLAKILSCAANHKSV